MKRRIFFWLERLKVTPAERRTISGLLVLLAFLAGLNLALSPSVPFGEGHYLELEKQFKKRAAMLKAEEDRLMEQYFPPEEERVYMAVEDTIPTEEPDEEPSQKVDQDAQKVKININKADKETLETLPGIGPTYARRIIEYRSENGGFKALEELKKIKGIAQKRLEKLTPFVKLKDSK